MSLASGRVNQPKSSLPGRPCGVWRVRRCRSGVRGSVEVRCRASFPKRAVDGHRLTQPGCRPWIQRTRRAETGMLMY